MTGTVSNIAALNNDIATAGSASSGSFTVTLPDNIVETKELDPINPQNGVSLTIIGSGGASVERANRRCQPANSGMES